MRADMFKVIVERPRKWKDHRRRAAALRRDFDGPAFLGMRAGHGVRVLNENLAPLHRFLRAQRGRPWNQVMSELRACIDTRSAVKLHILEHLEDFVTTKTWMQDGECWFAVAGGTAYRMEGAARPALYVDPRTGILCENRWCQSRRAQYEESRQRRQAEEHARRRILSSTVQLLRIDGLWYHVEVAPLPAHTPKRDLRGRSRRDVSCRWDVIRRAWVSRDDGYAWGDAPLGGRYLFGSAELYAVSKRQLNKRELRAAGLGG